MVTLAAPKLEYAPPKLVAVPTKQRPAPGLAEVVRLLKSRGMLEAWEKGKLPVRYVQALMALPEARALSKKGRAVLLVLLGVALGTRGQLAEALEAFTSATALDPDSADAWYNKGVALGQLQRYPEAVAAYDQVADRFGKAPEAALRERVATALGNKGVALGRLQRYPEAVAAYDQVADRFGKAPEAALREQVAKALFTKGVALGQLQRYPEAVAAYEKAYTLRSLLPDKGALLFRATAAAALILGLSGITNRWLPDLEAGTKAYIRWRERARRDKQLPAFRQAMKDLEANLPKEEKEALEGFKLSVRLLSIRDPFKGWKALSREVSKRWPKNVTAVQAIRRQRR